MNRVFTHRADRVAKAVERRGIRATYELHDRVLSNRKSRALYEDDRPQLDDVQQSDPRRRRGERVRDRRPSESSSRTTSDWRELEAMRDRFVAETEADLAKGGEHVRVRAGKEFVVRLHSYGVELGLDDPWFRAVASHRLLDIANAYLEMWSKLEYVDVWYSVPQPAEAQRISSQRWHRDYNDKHLLKVFLYLVDVDEAMGPFQYVPGSQPGGPYAHAWPWQPLGQNYPTEEELEALIPSSSIQAFTAPKGTLIFCNTAGFHRGGFSTTDPRVLATATYSSPASLASLTVRSYELDGLARGRRRADALRAQLSRDLGRRLRPKRLQRLQRAPTHRPEPQLHRRDARRRYRRDRLRRLQHTRRAANPPRGSGRHAYRRCRSCVRVLRVRASVHAQRFSDLTPLPIVEPLARNVAARRTDAANRWLLMTNTDMAFLPLSAASLTDVCSRLVDDASTHFLGSSCPSGSGSSFRAAIPHEPCASCETLGPALRLDEVTTSHDWLRFDSAGDFQLVLRDDFFAIDGLDEEMLLGWHVDANLGKRMLLRGGSIGSLEHELAGYHCNHLRTATTYQSSDVANDLHRFVLALEEPELPAQRDSWDFAGDEVEEVELAPEAARSFTTAVAAASGDAPSPPRPTDARDEKWRLEYDSGHVLAFVADAIRVAPPGSAIAYLGVNSTLERMLHELVGELECPLPLTVLAPGSEATAALAAADVAIVDLGIDSSLVDEPLADAVSPRATAYRLGLIEAFDTLGAYVDVERARVRDGGHPRQLVLVNSTAIYWNAFCRAHLHCGPTTPHAGVRRATVKLVPDDDEVTRAATTRARQLRRWIARRDSRDRSLSLRPGQSLRVESLEEYAGFGSGWGFPDHAGISTRGSRAELSVSAAEAGEAWRLRLTFDPVVEEAETTARGFLALHPTVTHTGDGLVWEIEPRQSELASGIVDLVLELGDDPRRAPPPGARAARSRRTATSRGAFAFPVEQRAHDSAPLTGERPARGVALTRIQHLERDRLVDRRVVLELREVDAADGGFDDRRSPR